MAHYTITHTCGHEERVNLVGKESLRQRRIQHMEQEQCFECYKQQRTQAAQQEAEEQELPPLVGTESQVAYGLTVRSTLVRAIETFLLSVEHPSPVLLQAVEHILQETSAHQWIEWREYSARVLLDMECKRIDKLVQQSSEHVKQQEIARLRALHEATIRPPSPRTETVAEIRVRPDGVEVAFPELREDFRALVKFRLGYTWVGTAWRRTLTARNGTPLDRASELAHTLLASGFVIRCFDEHVRDRAIKGLFIPEITRWIQKQTTGPYTGWFAVRWGHHEDYYSQVRRIPGTRYDGSCVHVPQEQIDQLLDFATLYDFQLSAVAKAYVQEVQTFRQGVLTATIELHPQPKGVFGVSPRPVLDVPERVEVLDAFREDEA